MTTDVNGLRGEKYVEFDENRRVKERGMKVNGKRHGEVKCYWTDKYTDYSIGWKGNFVNGKEEGEFLSFYPKLKCLGHPEGDVWVKEEYENGVVKRSVSYSRSGGILEIVEDGEVVLSHR